LLIPIMEMWPGTRCNVRATQSGNVQYAQTRWTAPYLPAHLLLSGSRPGHFRSRADRVETLHKISHLSAPFPVLLNNPSENRDRTYTGFGMQTPRRHGHSSIPYFFTGVTFFGCDWSCFALLFTGGFAGAQTPHVPPFFAQCLQ